jgi:hypothetical protein
MRFELDGSMIEEFFAKRTRPISMGRNDHDDATEIDSEVARVRVALIGSTDMVTEWNAGLAKNTVGLAGPLQWGGIGDVGQRSDQRLHFRLSVEQTRVEQH